MTEDLENCAIDTMGSLTMKVLALSINTAKRAGTIIKEVMKSGNLEIVEKGHNDLQTEADRSAQKCIIASLSKQFPNIKIIGEEGSSDLNNIPSEWLVNQFDLEFLKYKCPIEYSNIQEKDIVVWIDPLDGTTEYTQGFLEHVTILIGIAFQNSAIGGIIHQPYYKRTNGEIGRTIWGLKGLGIGGDDEFQLTKPPENEFIVTTSRTHSTKEVQDALDALNPTKILRVGGAGYKVLQLIEGKAHAYVFASPGCKKWDTCAPEAILEACGGILTDICGRHYEYNETVQHKNKCGVLATAKGISHQTIVDKIPEIIKKSLSNDS